MTARVLLSARHPPPWVRTVAAALGDVESAADVEAVVLYVFDATGPVSDAETDAAARERTAVDAAVSTLADAGVDAVVRGTTGDDPAGAIVSAADRYGVDRIYMYARPRSPAGKAVFGSTLHDVLATADVPVVVVPPGAG